MNFSNHLNIGQNQLKGAVAEKLATAPTTPISGQFYFNTATNKLMWYNGTAWISAAGDIVNGSIVNAQLADVLTATLKGRATAGTGAVEDLTATQARTLLNVANGATANSADATLLSRANHTGTQTAATISDFDTEVANNSAVAANTAKVTNASHTGDVTGSGALTIAGEAVTLPKMAKLAVNSIMGNNTAALALPKALTPTEVRTLLNVADGATANAGTVTGVTATTPVQSTGGTAPIISMPAATNISGGYATSAHVVKIEAADAAKHTHTNKTTLDAITAAFLAADRTKLDGIAAGATANVGTVTGVTATSPVQSSGGAAPVISMPAATTGANGYMTSTMVTNLNAANTAKHTQNTDTGTSSSTFILDSVGGGAGIKTSIDGQELQAIVAGGATFSDFRCKNLSVEGTTTTVNSNDVNIGDSVITLNSDATAAAYSDGGICVKTFDGNIETDAIYPSLYYSITEHRWIMHTMTENGTLAGVQIAKKMVFTIGDGVATSFNVNHYFLDEFVSVTVLNNTTKEIEYTDVKLYTGMATVTFTVAPAVDEYTIIIIG